MKSDHLKVGFQSVDRETICRSCPTAARFIVDDCHRKSTHDPFIDIHWNVLLAQLSHWPSRFTEFWWIWWIFWRLQEPETRATKRTLRKRIEGRERERERRKIRDKGRRKRKGTRTKKKDERNGRHERFESGDDAAVSRYKARRSEREKTPFIYLYLTSSSDD